jgi:hypothetical protein
MHSVVWPGRARWPQRKHAFDEVLEEAGFDPDAELFDEPSLNGPAVADFYDIAVAPDDYMAASSLVRAYEDDEDPEEVYSPPEGPADAARRLKGSLAERPHSAEELARARRCFAAIYHPDKVSAETRAEAVEAMAAVNAEIDRALKKIRPI